MGSNNNFTFFQSGTGSGGSASQYLQDNFNDLTLPATNNTSLTNSASTNPLSKNFGNDDQPKYGIKTLYVQDLVLLQNRSQWVNNKPTYQVIPSEPMPGIFWYVFGNVRLRNSVNGKSIDLRDTSDGMGVTSVARRVMWGVNSSLLATATAQLQLDGVNGSTITYGASANTQVGTNQQNYFVQEATNETKDLHDFRLITNQIQATSVFGVAVYFENATQNVDIYPGSTYINKVNQTTTGLTTMALAVPVGNKGANTAIYKTSINTYSQQTLEPNNLSTVATGSSGTNAITVSTGSGASFPAGVGFVTSFGTSMFVGGVLSVSTDTLTVGPTLPFGVSGPMYKSWWAGPTIAINASLYSLAFQFDPMVNEADADAAHGFLPGNTGDLYFSDQLKRYRVWGQQLSTVSYDGNYGVAPTVGGTGFIQAEGSFSCAEIEMYSPGGIMHGTLSINGVPAWGINEGVTGFIKKTLFAEGGPGWHNAVFTYGSSFGLTCFTKINFYQNAISQGVTLGLLAEYKTFENEVERTAFNATLSALGTYRRVFSDEIYMTGAWVRGVTSGAAGCVQYLGSSTNSVLNFQYYGKDFSILGTAGSSGVLTLDGASIAVNFGKLISGGSNSFHSVVYTHKAGTSIIHGLDFTRPNGEIKSLENTSPLFISQVQGATALPTVYYGSNTPLNPVPGTIWSQNKGANSVWIYLFDRWNLINISASSDDPALLQMIRSHGTTSGSGTPTASAVVELFNQISWISGTSDSTSLYSGTNGDGSIPYMHVAIDGLSSGGAVSLFNRQYNKASWSSGTNRTTARQSSGAALLSGFLYVGKGATSTDISAPSTAVDAYNGASWTAGIATLGTASSTAATFTQGGKARWVMGVNGSGGLNIHDTYNGTSVSTDTLTGTAAGGFGGSSVSTGGGLAGAMGVGANTIFVWSGASWSSTALSYAAAGAGSAPARNSGSTSASLQNGGNTYYNSGQSDQDTPINKTSKFNGASWSVSISSSTTVSGSSGCAA